MKVFFVRHGQATHNVANETGEAYDPNNIVLTDRGKTQAKLTGEYIKEVYGTDFDIVYTSPATRCKETGKIIMKELGYDGKFIKNKKLREILEGNKLDGMSNEEGSKEFEEAGLAKMIENTRNEKSYFKKIEKYKEFRNKFQVLFGGYSFDDACVNLTKFLKKLKKKDYKKVLIVTHSSVMPVVQNIVCNVDIYNEFLQICAYEQTTFNNKNPIPKIESNNCCIMALELVDKKFRLVMPMNNLHLKDKIQTGGSNEEFNSWLNDKFNECWDIPGLSMVIFNSDEILYSATLGYANMETERKLKETDKFCIASCFKSVLCLAITIGIKEGGIPNIWEMVLGDFFENCHKDFANCKIEYLANHTSGISDNTNNCPKRTKVFKKYENLEGMESRNKIAEYILKREPSYPVNSKREYSNIGYGILGCIIEKITKQNYSIFVNKHVFAKLNSDVDYHIYRNGNGYAEGHKIDKNVANSKYEPLELTEHPNPTYEGPAGDCYITSQNFAKYAQQYLLATQNKGLFDKSVYKTMTETNKDNYAKGIKFENGCLSHSGGYYNILTQFRIYPAKNIGFVVCTNCYGFSFNEIVEKFEQMYCK
jgi:broad specificity phosphatase PhoE/CubicO group peptidase (beta-lactamase class C family)